MKKLVVFGGPPCTGKSAVGHALGWAHLEMDEARPALLPEAGHSREDRKVAYRAVRWAAAHLLPYTDIVICNGGYGHAEDRAACRELAQDSGARLYIVEFTAPLPVLLERNRARRAFHPGLDLTDERVTEIWHTYPWSGEGLLVDGSRPVADCADAVRKFVEAGGIE